jgi:hypothetical protein
VDAIPERERGAHGVPEMVKADVGEDAIPSMFFESTTCGHYTMRVLTPLLTPMSVQYAETASNRQQRNRLM